VTDGEPKAEQSRHDRELIELLNELRVVLPGVQVLFAFLLTVPFTLKFIELSGSQRAAFVTALLSAAAATALLIAPSAFHRLRFREHDKEAILQAGNRLTIAGLACLALAIVAAIYVVMDLMYDTPIAVLIAAAAAVAFLLLWFVLPAAGGDRSGARS
jgi:hypothetical protein